MSDEIEKGNLVLTRNVGQSLIIGNDIRISVVGVKGNQARLHISAPKNVAVHREEIFIKIQEEKKANELN